MNRRQLLQRSLWLGGGLWLGSRLAPDLSAASNPGRHLLLSDSQDAEVFLARLQRRLGTGQHIEIQRLDQQLMEPWALAARHLHNGPLILYSLLEPANHHLLSLALDSSPCRQRMEYSLLRHDQPAQQRLADLMTGGAGMSASAPPISATTNRQPRLLGLLAQL